MGSAFRSWRGPRGGAFVVPGREQTVDDGLRIKVVGGKELDVGVGEAVLRVKQQGGPWDGLRELPRDRQAPRGQRLGLGTRRALGHARNEVNDRKCPSFVARMQGEKAGGETGSSNWGRAEGKRTQGRRTPRKAGTNRTAAIRAPEGSRGLRWGGETRRAGAGRVGGPSAPGLVRLVDCSVATAWCAAMRARYRHWSNPGWVGRPD